MFILQQQQHQQCLLLVLHHPCVQKCAIKGLPACLPVFSTRGLYSGPGQSVIRDSTMCKFNPLFVFWERTEGGEVCRLPRPVRFQRRVLGKKEFEPHQEQVSGQAPAFISSLMQDHWLHRKLLFWLSSSMYNYPWHICFFLALHGRRRRALLAQPGFQNFSF